MRVLLACDTLVNGGLERQLALLATSLPATWEVRVWSMGGGEFHEHLAKRGIPVTLRRRIGRFDPSPAVWMVHDLRSWRPDIVHSWSWMSALAATSACRLLQLPHVDGMIRSGAIEPDYTALKRYAMHRATLVVANSWAGLRAWGVGPDRGRVVYNGFDRSRIPAAGLAQPMASRLTVVMTGRMSPVKHFEVVIEAARELSRRWRGWRFLLVGNGSQRRRLMAEARNLIDEGIVEFPAPTLEVMPYVQTADIGVLMTNPSYRDEGLSNSIMEYMALGLPVLCGRGGGNAELVLDGTTGLIVPPADVAAVVEGLEYLRARPEERARMGAAGRLRIATEFSVENMVRSTLATYAEAMASTTTSSRHNQEVVT